MTKAPILQRSRADIIVASVLCFLTMFAVSVVWLTAPIRKAELTPADGTFTAADPLVQAPDRLSESWRVTVDPITGLHRPLSVAGLLIQPDGGDVHALDPTTGERVWTYHRDNDQLCSLSVAFESVIATYNTNVGCGDVVAINANTGTYKATRSAINSFNTVPISSNSAVGTLSRDRLELWRSDLVRTIEYGHVEAPQEADQQPHPDCALTSALTRMELLAITDLCPDSITDGVALRFMGTTPEDSRQPEIKQSIDLEPHSTLVSLNAATVPSSPLLDGTAPTHHEDRTGVDTPQIADLPHHMSWFDGQRLYLFEPENLLISHIFEGALGTGIAVGGQLLYPNREGIAVADWNTGKILRVIPVDRQGYDGPVSLNQAGHTIIEQRDDTYVALN